MLFKQKMKKKNSSVKEQAQMSNYMLSYLTRLNLNFSIQYLSSMYLILILNRYCNHFFELIIKIDHYSKSVAKILDLYL